MLAWLLALERIGKGACRVGFHRETCTRASDTQLNRGAQLPLKWSAALLPTNYPQDPTCTTVPHWLEARHLNGNGRYYPGQNLKEKNRFSVPKIRRSDNAGVRIGARTTVVVWAL
jgi:hypothetical protein